VNDIVEGLFFLPFEEYNIFCMARCFQIQRKKPWSILWSREAYILPPTINPTRKDLEKDKGNSKEDKTQHPFVLVIPMVLPSYTNPFRFEYHPLIPMITFQT
jgi:hypothetical protein